MRDDLLFLQLFGGNAQNDIHADDAHQGDSQGDVEGERLVESGDDGDGEENVEEQICEFVKS